MSQPSETNNNLNESLSESPFQHSSDDSYDAYQTRNSDGSPSSTSEDSDLERFPRQVSLCRKPKGTGRSKGAGRPKRAGRSKGPGKPKGAGRPKGAERSKGAAKALPQLS